MSPYMRTEKIELLTKTTVLVVIIIFLGLRFVYLEADFPSGITWSGVLYTDEGWYSNGAASYFISGNWLIEGDFNTIVNVPIFQLLQSLTFKLIGLSLFSARITPVVISVFMVLFIYLLVRKYTDKLTALVAASLLSTNYIVYAYSRLAILDLPMISFVLLSILVVLSFPKTNHFIVIGVSSVIFCLSVLTKTNALFALPVYLYATSLRQTNVRKRLSYCGWALVFVIILLSIYYLLINSSFNVDYEYFTSLNIASRISWNPASIVRNFIRAVWHGVQLEPVLYPLTLTVAPICMFISPNFRKNNLVVLSMIWIVSYLCVLTVYSYQPPRYILPLSVPIVILFSLSSISLYRKLQPRLSSYLPMIVGALIIIMNGFGILQYLQKPNFSFLNMAHDIQHTIEVSMQHDQDVVLLGDIANSIGLVTGISSINATQGTRDLAWKLSFYEPEYYVSVGIENIPINTIEKYFDVEEISTYNVFNNYNKGKAVHFYRITKR